jgi:hypothetical protein
VGKLAFGTVLAFIVGVMASAAAFYEPQGKECTAHALSRPAPALSRAVRPLSVEGYRVWPSSTVRAWGW